MGHKCAFSQLNLPLETAWLDNLPTQYLSNNIWVTSKVSGLTVRYAMAPDENIIVMRESFVQSQKTTLRSRNFDSSWRSCLGRTARHCPPLRSWKLFFPMSYTDSSTLFFVSYLQKARKPHINYSLTWDNLNKQKFLHNLLT